MNWQTFENNMRESAETHETPVDHEILWQKIRQKKKRRRGILIWWLSGTVTLGTIALILLSRSTNTLENPDVQPAQIVQLEQPSLTNRNENPDIKVDGTTTVNNIPNVQQQVAKRHPAPAIPNNTLATNKTWSAKTVAVKVDAPTPVIGSKEVITIVQPDSHDENTSSFQNSLQSIEQQGLVTGIKPEHIAALSAIPPADQEWLFPFINPLSSQVKPAPEQFHGAGKDYEQRKKHRHAVFAGIEAGYAVWNIYRSRSDRNLLRRIGERELEAVSLGLHGSFRVAGHFSIRTGVQYSRVTSVFDWQQSWEAEARPLIIHTFIDGRVDSLYYGIPTLHQFDRTVKNYNHIHTLNIPLDMQYTFHAGKWTIAPFAGIQPGFSFGANGVIEGPDGKPVKDEFRKIYRNVLTISGRGGVYCALSLREKLQITIAPTAVFDLTGRVKSSAFPQEKFRQVGVNVGLVRRFGF